MPIASSLLIPTLWRNTSTDINRLIVIMSRYQKHTKRLNGTSHLNVVVLLLTKIRGCGRQLVAATAKKMPRSWEKAAKWTHLNLLGHIQTACWATSSLLTSKQVFKDTWSLASFSIRLDGFKTQCKACHVFLSVSAGPLSFYGFSSINIMGEAKV